MFNNQKDNIPPRPPLQNGRPNRFALIFFLVIAVLFGAYFFRSNEAPVIQEIPYSAFTNYLDRNEVTAVKILDNSIIEGTLRGSSGEPVRFKTLIPYEDPGLLPTLRERGINVSGGVSGLSPMRLFLELLPWIIGFGLVWLMFRNMQGSGNKAFQFGKSRAKRYQDEG
jgi:cell division protease FtsH